MHLSWQRGSGLPGVGETGRRTEAHIYVCSGGEEENEKDQPLALGALQSCRQRDDTTKSALVRDMAGLLEELSKRTRASLFDMMVRKCRADYDARWVPASEQPYLKLKQRRGRSAHLNRCEEVYNTFS